MRAAALALLLPAAVQAQAATAYTLSSTPLGPVFHGVGGVSAGASSQTLFEYAPAVSSKIMDALFKPNYGASLHSLKVEIGGDGQSTEGSEPSHSHALGDLNCNRGYEWELMAAARARNPAIHLGGLPWCWPAWVGVDQDTTPYKHLNTTVSYAVSWVQCAKDAHNISMTYMSGWNERTESAAYMKALRTGLDAAGFADTALVCGDGVHAFNCAKLVAADPELKAMVFALGGHGPVADPVASATGLPLWNNEAHFSKTDGSDWAVELNSAYLNGNITGLQFWALVSGYDAALPFSDEGVMRAWWPTSGHFEAIGRLWVTAHTTQFTQPRSWHFLANGPGAGKLRGGGTYVTYLNPTSGDWTLVVEKMVGGGASAEDATFTLSGLAAAAPLALWLSDLSVAHAGEEGRGGGCV